MVETNECSEKCILIACLVEVIQPSIRWPLVTTPIDVLIAFNLIAQYYFVCTVKPGFVDEPAQVSGEGFFWAKKVTKSSRNPRTGVKWTEDSQFHITRAHVTRCKRCGQLRPEVRPPFIVNTFIKFEIAGLEGTSLPRLQSVYTEV